MSIVTPIRYGRIRFGTFLENYLFQQPVFVDSAFEKRRLDLTAFFGFRNDVGLNKVVRNKQCIFTVNIPLNPTTNLLQLLNVINDWCSVVNKLSEAYWVDEVNLQYVWQQLKKILAAQNPDLYYYTDEPCTDGIRIQQSYGVYQRSGYNLLVGYGFVVGPTDIQFCMFVDKDMATSFHVKPLAEVFNVDWDDKTEVSTLDHTNGILNALTAQCIISQNKQEQTDYINRLWSIIQAVH